MRRDPDTRSSVDLVLFDCDGVLVDSERVAVRVDQRVLAHLGWELEIDEIVERFMGGTTAAFRSAVEEHLGRRLPETWESPYEEWYEQAFVVELVAVDGIEGALDALDVATCVASNGPHTKLNRTLGLTGLLPRFEGRLFSSDDVVHGKPAPDLYLHAAAVMGVAPSRCVVVEDSRPGTTAALAAGMRVLGYAGGLTPSAWLGDLGATVFDDMHELPTLIGDMR